MKKAIQIKEFVSMPLFYRKRPLNKNVFWPKISIITPSYNQGRFLERTILSILNQNYPNLELIVIDGGSNDDSIEIIKKYEEYIDYWVSEEDEGQSNALDKGFKKATGNIIGWQNSDDIYLNDAFHKIAEFFKNGHGVDVIYGNRLDIDENDDVIGRSIFTKFSLIVFKYEGISLGTQSTFWRKELFSKIGYLETDYRFAMDYEFFLRAAVKKIKFKHVPCYFGAMRRHNLSKTELFSGTLPHRKECEQIAEKYGKRKWLNFPMRTYSLLFRTINYFLQGDIDYVFGGFKRRVKDFINH